MRAIVRFPALLLLALVASTAFTTSASAAERALTASFVVDTKTETVQCARCGPFGTPSEYPTCSYAVFVQFPHVAGASQYKVTVKDSHPQVNTTTTYVGPPFNDDHEGWKAPAGTHRFGGLTGGGGPPPCPGLEEGRFSVLKSVVVFDDKPRIAGTVSKADGSPAERVRVTVRGAGAAVTDGTGGYAVKLRTKGRYTVSAPKGYCAAGVRPCTPSKTVQVGAGATIVNFRKERDLRLGGTLVLRTCGEERCSVAPLPGVQVTAGGKVATTGDDGRYELELEGGTYTVRPESEAHTFEPEQQRVDLERDTRDIDFAACTSDDPVAGTSRDAREGAPPCKVVIDWEMPRRLTLTSGSTWVNGLVDRDDVNPSSWQATVKLVRNGDRIPCGPKERYRFTVKPLGTPGARVALPAGGTTTECGFRLIVNHLGTYRVRAQREVKRNGSWSIDRSAKPLVKDVLLRDWLIVGMGDSNGSGEGNPPFFYKRCNRSNASYQYQSAYYVEDQDPRSSVTFIHTSCSGARIEHATHVPYAGTRRGLAPLTPQAQQVRQLLAANEAGERRRKVDAVLASVGVNDLAFGPLMSYCVFYARAWVPSAAGCEESKVRPKTTSAIPTGYVADARSSLTLRQHLERLDGRLEARFTPMGPAMASLGVQKRRVYLANYPDFAHDEDGTLCDHDDEEFLVQWPQSTWAMLSDSSRTLNRHVAAAGGRLGFTTIPSDQSAFAQRGYCSNRSVFVGIFTAGTSDDSDGPFHPNREAHVINMFATVKRLCADLYRGDEQCDPEP